MTKVDPLTGEEFIPKKISQRFANKENRIKFNNEKAKNIRIELAPIINPLKLNYKIIKDLLGDNMVLIKNKEFLKGKGFNFSVSTGNEILKGKIYPMIFEYLIMNDYSNDEVKIMLWQ